MANHAERQHRLMEFFRDKLEIDVPAPETDLIETGLMDSLVFVELLFQLERDWGVTIAVETVDLDRFRSIASIVACIDELETIHGREQVHPAQDGPGLTGVVQVGTTA